MVCSPPPVAKVEIVEDGQVEGGGDRALLLVAAGVNVLVVCTAIGEPVNQPWIAMEGEDDGPVTTGSGIGMATGGRSIIVNGPVPHPDGDFQWPPRRTH